MIISKKLAFALFAIASIFMFVVSCTGRRNNVPASDEDGRTITVTILPLKYIVENITGNDFDIKVLVPAGASPETFEPTPKQYIALNESAMVFSTGLIDFETALTARMDDQDKIVNLSRGIELMEGSCAHNHTEIQSGHEEDDDESEGHPAAENIKDKHRHGIDPHIWTSPQELKIMARNAFEAITKQFPDSTKYRTAYNELSARLDTLDNECRRMCEESTTKAFVIYHPALTYFARAYGLKQIAVESDGKEPSAKYVAQIIDQSKAEHITCLLYQKEYPRSVVEIIAHDMGVDCREIDPLAENVEQNIIDMAHAVTGR